MRTQIGLVTALSLSIIALEPAIAGDSRGPMAFGIASSNQEALREKLAIDTLHDFDGSPDGGDPNSGLLADSQGDLFGTTMTGGAFNQGSVYGLSRNGRSYGESILYSFQNIQGVDGQYPVGTLVEDNTGSLYGVTHSGGLGCGGFCGTVFRLTPGPSGYKQTVIYNLLGRPTDGQGPVSGLIMGANGILYGTTPVGGPASCNAGCGTVYEVVPGQSGYTESVIYSFQNDGQDGVFPWAALIQGDDGALYGTTSEGGPRSQGTVFKLTPSASGYTETVLYAFQGYSDGSQPMAQLYIDNRGVLFGTTKTGGGVCNCGTIFSLTPGRHGYSEGVLHSFQGGRHDGSKPLGGLTPGGHGTFYGTASYGGAYDDGVLYLLRPNRLKYSLEVVYSFAGGEGGAYPADTLLRIKEELYGTTSGSNSPGTVFKAKMI